MIGTFLPILAASNPIDHVIDKPLIKHGEGYASFFTTDPNGSLWLVSNVSVMLILGAIVTMLLVIPAARRIKTGDARTIEDFRTQGILANFVEVICLYMRNDVFKPVLQEHTDRYTPMLWTMFWYILVCNLLGLVPILDLTAGIGTLIGVPIGYNGYGIGGTATQSIWVTGALALVAALFYMGVAMVKDLPGFLKHLTGGAPIFMWPIMIPVEVAGYLIKPFALAIRLFANMTGGHLILAVLFSFVPLGFNALGFGGGLPIGIFAMIGALAINLLEILVACIQAYIFTFLTCLFLGQLIVHEHDEHEAHGEDHDHAEHDHHPSAHPA